VGGLKEPASKNRPEIRRPGLPAEAQLASQNSSAMRHRDFFNTPSVARFADWMIQVRVPRITWGL